MDIAIVDDELQSIKAIQKELQKRILSPNIQLFLDDFSKIVNYSFDIYLHDARLRQNDISDTQATGTIIHELGHGFGLAHNNSNPNSIMCQLKTATSARLVNTVQKVDNDALNRLY